MQIRVLQWLLQLDVQVLLCMVWLKTTSFTEQKGILHHRTCDKILSAIEGLGELRIPELAYQKQPSKQNTQETSSLSSPLVHRLASHKQSSVSSTRPLPPQSILSTPELPRHSIYTPRVFMKQSNRNRKSCKGGVFVVFCSVSCFFDHTHVCENGNAEGD